MYRKEVNGLTIIPETHALPIGHSPVDKFEYKIYDSRDKTNLLKKEIKTGLGKDSYTYYGDEKTYDDEVLFFTTNVGFADGTWYGESPLTRAVLRREQVSATGVIVTPEIDIDGSERGNGGFRIIGSTYTRYDGTSEHEITDYLIEDDINSKVVFKVTTRTDLTSIKVPIDIFESNRVYRIRMRYKDKVGRYSNYGTLMYTHDNILYSMFTDNELIIPKGSDYKLPSKLTEYQSSGIKAEIYEAGTLKTTINMDIDYNIVIPDSILELGATLDIKLIKGNSVRNVKGIIVKDYGENYNPYNKPFLAKETPITLDGIVNNNLNSVLYQKDDDKIYDVVSGNLVSMTFTNNRLENYVVIKNLGTIPGIANVKKVFHHGTDTILCMDLPTMTRLVILDKDWNVKNTLEYGDNGNSFVYSTDLAIIRDDVYMTADLGANEKMLYKLSLKDYTLTQLGLLTLLNITPDNSGSASTKGYTTISRNDELYLVNTGGTDAVVTIASEILKIDIYTLAVKKITLTPTSIKLYMKGGSLGTDCRMLPNNKLMIYRYKYRDSAGALPRNNIEAFIINVDTGVITSLKSEAYNDNEMYENIIILKDKKAIFHNNLKGIMVE